MQRIAALALGLTAALVISPAARAQAPGSSGVKIGILNDQSGVYADFGGKWSVEAAHMAVEDFGGKIFGKRIEILSADHQNKPDVAIGIARRWYDVEGVDAIMELTTSSVALAVQQLSKDKKKTVYRDSEDGQFVPQEYAETHKRTTEKERVRVVPPGKAKK